MTQTQDSSTRFVLPECAPILANLAALWATDPHLATQLESTLDLQPYPVESSRCGLPTLSLKASDGRSLHLHSRHQPADEARRLIDSLDLRQNVVFAVQGFGLGYHIEELFNRASEEALILIFEPDLLLLRTAFEHRDFSAMISTGRIHFIPRLDRSLLLSRLGNQQALVCVGMATLSHAPSIQLQPSFHRQGQVLLDEFAAYCRTSINTLVINGRRTCENLANNLHAYVCSPGINRLKNRHARQPAIIVSAGPSLRKNGHLLKDAKGKAVLIAVQTTLRPMLELGVEPDYVTSLDYHDISTRFFEQLPQCLRAELVAEPKASSAVFSMYPGPLSLLGNDFCDRLIAPINTGKDRLRAGATVAHLAFYLAEYLGCDPIIFVGQDLGFTDGLCYAPGTSYEDVWRPELSRFCTMEIKQWEHIARERPILRRIPDQTGRPMYTEERLFSYLQQFERDFAATSARVIDSTEGGALKRGAAPMNLAEALSTFCTAALPPRQDDHPGRTAHLITPAMATLQHRLSEAQKIIRIGERTLPLLREVQDHLEDQPRVNQLIARIDTLRAEMFALNDCYELVTQLSQRTEMARFQADRMLAASRAAGVERQKKQLDRDIANVNAVTAAALEFKQLVESAVASLDAAQSAGAVSNASASAAA